MIELYRAVWRVSGRQQLLLIALSLATAALAAAPLKFQQLVINSLVEGGTVERLVWLCAAFLGAVLLSAGLKFVLSLRISVLGERVILMARERLYGNAVHDTQSGKAEPIRRGTLVNMLTAEAEVVGGFAGSAIAGPLLQLGTLVSVLTFVFVQQPRLGIIVAAVVIPQAVIVVTLQKRINREVRARVTALRDASDRISQSDLLETDAAVAEDFRLTFTIRRRIYAFKLSIKLALSVITALGAVAILFIGGWLVLQGRSDVGTVVASLSGLARIDGPWRTLIQFFRQASTVRVNYEMLTKALAKRG